MQHLHLWDSATKQGLWEHSSTSRWVVNQRWLPLLEIQRKYRQRNISASALVNNENSKATSTLLGSSNTAGLVWTQSDIGVSDKSNMAAIIGSMNKIPASTLISNEILEATPAFPRTSNTTLLAITHYPAMVFLAIQRWPPLPEVQMK